MRWLLILDHLKKLASTKSIRDNVTNGGFFEICNPTKKILSDITFLKILSCHII